MFRKLLAYYLPFDTGLEFRLPWIWEHAKKYAFRNAIAGFALAGISSGAEVFGLPLAATGAQVLTAVSIFFATIFAAAALDPRFR